uniref:P-type domain-containing protein n=1 Tax=Gopherus evgoodei TaxID=1825980 RepID=A0A8C4VFT8_9SAUR
MVIQILALLLSLGRSTETDLKRPLYGYKGPRISSKERKDYGKLGINAVECQTKRYCFDAKYPSVPWCFHPRIKKAPGECDVQPKARENCGYAGITEIECSARQCCFNSDAPDSPWCFKPVPSEVKCHAKVGLGAVCCIVTSPSCE